MKNLRRIEDQLITLKIKEMAVTFPETDRVLILSINPT